MSSKDMLFDFHLCLHLTIVTYKFSSICHIQRFMFTFYILLMTKKLLKLLKSETLADIDRKVKKGSDVFYVGTMPFFKFKFHVDIL